MKKIFIFLILLSTLSFGQYANERYEMYVGTAIDKYQTITEALSHYVAGSVIILSTNYYDEDVVINVDGIRIKGQNKYLTKINKLIVYSKNCTFENFTVTDSLKILSEDDWNYLHNKNYFYNMIFQSNCAFGTPSLITTYPFEFHDCGFFGEYSKLYFNCYPGGQSNYFYNSYINGWDGIDGMGDNDPSNIDIYIKNGQVIFDGGRIYVDTIYYDIPTTGIGVEISLLYFQNMSQCYMGHIITPDDETKFKILQIKYGKFYWYNDMTFRGKFELVMLNCDLNLGYESVGGDKDIIFNSTANSRMINVSQFGYESTSTISGTGLDGLYIYNSTFKMNAPTGLGANVGNCWNCFIDN